MLQVVVCKRGARSSQRAERAPEGSSQHLSNLTGIIEDCYVCDRGPIRGRGLRSAYTTLSRPSRMSASGRASQTNAPTEGCRGTGAMEQRLAHRLPAHAEHRALTRVLASPRTCRDGEPTHGDSSTSSQIVDHRRGWHSAGTEPRRWSLKSTTLRGENCCWVSLPKTAGRG